MRLPVDTPLNTEYTYSPETELIYTDRKECTQRQRCYLSGPMRGYPNLGERHFRYGVEQLTFFGFRVYDPWTVEQAGERGDDSDPTREDIKMYAARDFALIEKLNPEEGDFLAVLPGWERSRGCVAEIALASWLMIPVYEFDGFNRWGLTPLDNGFITDPKFNRKSFLDNAVYYNLFREWHQTCPHCGRS